MKLKFVLILFVVFLNNYSGFAQQQGKASDLLVSVSSDSYLSSKLSEAFDALTVNPEYIKNNTGIATFKKSDFDFRNFYVSSIKGEPGKSIVAPYKGNTGNLEFAFVITEDGAAYSKAMLTKSVKDRSNVSFYNLSDGAALSIGKAGSSFTYKMSIITINDVAGRTSGCGQAAMNCIMDVYSNHGWVSIWATIQSIFVPATGVAIATACIVRNCIKH